MFLRHAQHFLDRRHAGQRLDQTVLVHRAHAFGARQFLDLAHVGVLHDQAPQRVAHDQEFHDRGAAVITGRRERRRHRFIQLDFSLRLEAAQAEFLDDLGQRLVAFGMGRLQAPHQTLGENAVDGRGQQVILHAHVEHARDAAGGVVGVQRRQHQMAGQRRLDRDLGGFQIAHFADHDDVRILTHDRTQRVARSPGRSAAWPGSG